MERPNSLDDGLGLLRLNTTDSGVSLDDEIQASTIEVCDNLPKLGAYVFLSLLELTIGEAKIEKIAKLQAEIASSGSGPVHATSPPVLGYDRSSVLQSDQLHAYLHFLHTSGPGQRFFAVNPGTKGFVPGNAQAQ